MTLKQWISKKRNRKIILFVAGAIMLYFWIRNRSKSGGASYAGLDGYGGGTITIKPPVVPGTEAPLPDYAWTPGNESAPKGTYTRVVGGRTYDFNKTPEFELQITENGITDVTPGLTRSGGISRLDGLNVFYAVGYFPVDITMENYILPDGIHTLHQYPCNAAKIPDFATFKAKFNGWNDGVNSDNARVSRIFLSVHSDTKRDNSIVPKWLRASRQLIFPSVAVPKDWFAHGKHFATGHINVEDSRSKYITLGVQPHTDLFGPFPQPGTYWCWKKPDDTMETENSLYQYGAGAMELMGNSPRSYLSSEIAENMQGKDGDIYGKTAAFYHGAFDKKGTKKGSWGDYGGDQYFGYIKPETLHHMTRSEYEQNLTTKLHHGFDTRGFSAGAHEFFTRNHYKWRGVNISYYFWQSEYNFPLQFAYARNKVKTGTMTYQGENNECDLSYFTATKTENFVARANGTLIGIEGATTGDIIPYPNGEMQTWHQQTPCPWDEQFTAYLWAGIIFEGASMWDAPGSTLGFDTTKLHVWGDRPPKWRKPGQGWETYNSGQNGAPVSDGNGLMHSMYAAPQDAGLAASEILWPLRDRLKVVRWAAYTSSAGSFTPTPGTAGLHMNGGNMPINHNLFVERDILDAQKATAVNCQGDGGGVVFYHNNFLAPHLYEDNVTVDGHLIGRVYGRQTAYKTY